MIKEIANNVVKILERKKYGLTVMEKGTDGLFVNSITETMGGFNVINEGFVFGEDNFKSHSLNRNLKNCIEINGINSVTVASMMAICCKEDTSAEVGIGITGIIYSDASKDDEIDYVVNFCINTPSSKVSGEIQVPKELEYNEDTSIRYQQQQYIVQEILNKLEECLNEEENENEETLEEVGKIPQSTIVKKVVLGVSLTTVTTAAMLIAKSFIKNRKKK